MASAGLQAVGSYKLLGGLTAGSVYWASRRVGETVKRLRLKGAASF
jgi:hypothetical protein